jgi:sugar-phosphatase
MINTVAVPGLLKGKHLLIFDFDGTLADTSPLHAQAFEKLLEPHGVVVNYPSIAGMKTSDAMRKCLLTADIVLPNAEIDKLTLAKQSYVRELIRQQLLPLPGVEAFLKWTRSRYRLALYSSGSRGTVELSLEKLGFSGWFDPMLCAEDVNMAKPAPEGFKKILQIMKLSTDSAIVFEDSEMGILAATRAEIEVVDVRPPFSFTSLMALP